MSTQGDRLIRAAGLGMDVLHCKTEPGVRKELAVFCQDDLLFVAVDGALPHVLADVMGSQMAASPVAGLALATGLSSFSFRLDRAGIHTIGIGVVDEGDIYTGSAAVIANLQLRLPGDANGDGTVNFADLLALAQNDGRTSATWAQGDFNGDGSVGFPDLLILAQNYGQNAAAAAVAAARRLRRAR